MVPVEVDVTLTTAGAHQNALVVSDYLDLLDQQRETALAAVAGLTEDQIWRRPGEKEWCIGEVLNHNVRVMASAMPYARFAWRFFRWYGERNRHKPYRNSIPDLYRTGNFPMWTGFLWTPRVRPDNRVPLDHLARDLRDLHQAVRDFYTGKDEDVLGHVSVWDPYFGWLNLILVLRLGIYHDQLHYEDVLQLAHSMRPASE
jgi:hypothetical protein